MTIEELPDAQRCPDCGTWLPRSALECPTCGRPRDIASERPPGRAPLSRRMLIGGGAAGAVVLAAVILFLISPHDDAPPGPSRSQAPSSEIAFATGSPSPTPRPTPTRSPIATPSVGASVEPRSTPLPPPVTRDQLVLPASILDIGPRAVVQVQNLRVRQFIGLDAGIQVQLGFASELLLRTGPVSADGYDWYWVYYQPLTGEPRLEDGGGQGWVASSPTGASSTFIQILPTRCPLVPVTVSLMASMSDIARTECLGTTSYEFHAVVQTCYEGPLTPYNYEPTWLGFSCWYLNDLGTDAWLQLHVPPAVSLPATFGRGDVVRVVGHVNDPAGDDCRVVPQGAGMDPTQIARDQQLFVISCRSAFVATEVEVTGHINLPDPFGT